MQEEREFHEHSFEEVFVSGKRMDLDSEMSEAADAELADFDVLQDLSWLEELEAALVAGCDFSRIRSIAKNRPLVDKVRPSAWQVLLGVLNRPDPFQDWDGIFDLPERSLIKQECKKVAETLGNPEGDRVSVTSDLESIMTLYCKTRAVEFEADNGWTHILQLLLVLRLPRHQLYNVFYSFTTKYIPRGCVRDGRPFDLFRLLLLYHDPQLCSFLDTRQITPDMYAKQWFNSLLSASCALPVSLRIWDIYLQQADPFLVFFLALVIILNARESVLEMGAESAQSVVERMSSLACQLEADDIDDFCQLSAFYSAKTPQSFRRDYHGPLFGSNLADAFENVSVHSLLCLPVSVQELLQSNQLSQDGVVRYFVVDARPMTQYTNGHLPGAFNLDASMLVNNPSEFYLATQTLGAFKKKTHPTDHLCLMGSGREEEDQYLHMVISSFLQKGMQYVSLARGGYAALHEVLRESLSTRLKSHSVKGCLMCNPPAPPPSSPAADSPAAPASPADPNAPSFLRRMREAVKSTSVVVKERVVDYIVNAQPDDQSRHVDSADRHGKRYRNLKSVFSIDEESDDGSGHSGDEGGVPEDLPASKQKIVVAQWLKQQADLVDQFPCQQVDDKNFLLPSVLAVTKSHVYVIREWEGESGAGWVKARRPLANIHRISSKKKMPELLTFRYGYELAPGQQKTTGLDRFLVPKAGDCAKVLKTAILSLDENLRP